MFTCSKCKKQRPASRFGLRQGSRNPRCKDCQNEYARQWRRDNPKRSRAADRRKYLRRRDDQIAYNKRYRKRKRDACAEWRANNPKTIAETTRVNKYGSMGYERGDYDRMLEEQGGKCALCGSEDPKNNGSFAVDHCHDTGRVRALLCFTCNCGMGQLGDDPELVRKAASYLEQWREIHGHPKAGK